MPPAHPRRTCHSKKIPSPTWPPPPLLDTETFSASSTRDAHGRVFETLDPDAGIAREKLDGSTGLGDEDFFQSTPRFMVKPLSIFIHYAGGEDDPVRAMGEIVGQLPERQDLDTGPVRRCRAFDVELALFGEHGLEDDSGIEFSKYEYQLQLTAFEAGLRIPAFESLYEAMSLFVAERLSDNLECETLVVENLQRKVALFRTVPKVPARDSDATP